MVDEIGAEMDKFVEMTRRPLVGIFYPDDVTGNWLETRVAIEDEIEAFFEVFTDALKKKIRQNKDRSRKAVKALKNK